VLSTYSVRGFTNTLTPKEPKGVHHAYPRSYGGRYHAAGAKHYGTPKCHLFFGLQKKMCVER